MSRARSVWGGWRKRTKKEEGTPSNVEHKSMEIARPGFLFYCVYNVEVRVCVCVCVFTELIQYLGSLFQVFVVEVVDESCPTHAHTHRTYTHTHHARDERCIHIQGEGQRGERHVRRTHGAHARRATAPTHTHTHTHRYVEGRYISTRRNVSSRRGAFSVRPAKLLSLSLTMNDAYH